MKKHMKMLELGENAVRLWLDSSLKLVSVSVSLRPSSVPLQLLQSSYSGVATGDITAKNEGVKMVPDKDETVRVPRCFMLSTRSSYGRSPSSPGSATNCMRQYNSL